MKTIMMMMIIIIIIIMMSKSIDSYETLVQSEFEM